MSLSAIGVRSLLPLAHLLWAIPALAGPTETDRPYAGHGTLTLGAETLTLNGQRIVDTRGRVLVDRLLGPPVSRADVLCASDEGADGLGQLRCWNARREPVTLAVGGRPSRLALGATHLAWVASPGGIPQVFVAPLDGHAAPRGLTNVAIVAARGEALRRGAGPPPPANPGKAPAGFVPPPLRQSLRFHGDVLRWEAQDGPHEARWRGGAAP